MPHRILNEKLTLILSTFEKEVRASERVVVLAEIISWLCPRCKACDFPESIRARLTHKNGKRHINCGAAQIWMVFVSSGQPVRDEILKQSHTPNGEQRT